MFLPPYSPELNPAEKIWAKFKRDFTNRMFLTIEQLGEFISELVNTLQNKEVASICNYNYASNY
jgi:transposase